MFKHIFILSVLSFQRHLPHNPPVWVLSGPAFHLSSEEPLNHHFGCLGFFLSSVWNPLLSKYVLHFLVYSLLC